MFRRNKEHREKEKEKKRLLAALHKRQSSVETTKTETTITTQNTYATDSTESTANSTFSSNNRKSLRRFDSDRSISDTLSSSIQGSPELEGGKPVPYNVPQFSLNRPSNFNLSYSKQQLPTIDSTTTLDFSFNSSNTSSQSDFGSSITPAATAATSLNSALQSINRHDSMQSISGKSGNSSGSSTDKDSEKDKYIADKTLIGGIFQADHVINLRTTGISGPVTRKGSVLSINEASKIVVVANANIGKEEDGKKDLKLQEAVTPNFFGQVKITLDLSNEEIAILKKTWDQIVNDKDESGESRPMPMGGHGYGSVPIFSAVGSTLFCRQMYANLISMTPGIEQLFPSILHQSVAFAGVFSTTISQLDHIEVLDDYLGSLGRRHTRILGVEPFQYELMGRALMRTLSDRFEDDFTNEVEEAWFTLYNYIANKFLQESIDPKIINTQGDEVIPEDSLNMTQQRERIPSLAQTTPFTLAVPVTKNIQPRGPRGKVYGKRYTPSAGMEPRVPRLRGIDPAALQQKPTHSYGTSIRSGNSSNSGGSLRSSALNNLKGKPAQQRQTPYLQGDIEFQDCSII